MIYIVLAVALLYLLRRLANKRTQPLSLTHRSEAATQQYANAAAEAHATRLTDWSIDWNRPAPPKQTARDALAMYYPTNLETGELK
jgi:hypothetical protein